MKLDFASFCFNLSVMDRFFQTKGMNRVIILLVFSISFLLSCVTEKLDRLLVFAPLLRDEYDFSSLNVPETNWHFLWITNNSITTCILKIDRKIGVNDNLSNLVVAYFHGNRSCLDVSPVVFGNFFYELGINFIAVEYRGYGIIKDFEPSEESLYQDGDALIEYITSLGIPKSNIVVVGHSLGGGVATEIAKRHNLKALVLISTFTKIEDSVEMVATYKVPSRWYADSVFDNISKIGSIGEPVLIIHGKSDTTLSFSYGVSLYNKAKDPKDYLWIEDCNHSAKEIVQKGGESLKNKIVSFLNNL